MTKVVIKKQLKAPVGYKRPPKAHQFKPGQSGNPRGRPKGVPSLHEAMTKEAAKLVKVKQGDKIESIPKIVAVARRIFARALEGDLSAARIVLQLAADPMPSDDPAAEVVTFPTDDVIQRMVKRFDHLTSAKESKA